MSHKVSFHHHYQIKSLSKTHCIYKIDIHIGEDSRAACTLNCTHSVLFKC